MFGRLRGPKSAIIIGGGVAGASIARELARKGVGVTLLEKAGQLCAGATWHAAGLVTRFGGSPKIKKVHVRALELMTEMHDMYDVGLHITGSIRLIETGNADRMTDAKQHVAMAALYDDPELPTSLISPEEVQALHPLVNVSGVQAGVYTPRDGDVDPTLLTTCIGKLAKQDGAKFVFNAEVDTITRREDGVFEVVTAEGNHYEADAVINAAGLWSRRFSRQLGLESTHPAYVIEHQYAITETIPELKGKVHFQVIHSREAAGRRSRKVGLLQVGHKVERPEADVGRPELGGCEHQRRHGVRVERVWNRQIVHHVEHVLLLDLA